MNLCAWLLPVLLHLHPPVSLCSGLQRWGGLALLRGPLADGDFAGAPLSRHAHAVNVRAELRSRVPRRQAQPPILPRGFSPMVQLLPGAAEPEPETSWAWLVVILSAFSLFSTVDPHYIFSLFWNFSPPLPLTLPVVSKTYGSYRFHVEIVIRARTPLFLGIAWRCTSAILDALIKNTVHATLNQITAYSPCSNGWRW